MAEYLVIRLGTDPAQSAQWIAVDSNGTRQASPVTGALVDAAKDVGSRDVIVLVPATSVLTTAVNLPIRSSTRLRAALPFALEEQLADDVENLHFAAGTRRDTGFLPVAVVGREQMQEWIATLQAAGIFAHQMIPENHGLASIPGTLSMLIAEQQIMFDDGAESAFVLQDVKPSDVLAVAGVLPEASAGENPPTGHLLVYCNPEDESQFEQDWNALRHELTSVDINLLPDGVLPRLAVTVAAGRGVNLLQGRFGARTDYKELLAPWKYVAGLALALIVVGFASKGVDYYRLTAEQAALQSQFVSEYKLIRPNDTREILDPTRILFELRGARGGTTSTDVFLPSLHQLSVAMRENAEAKIEAISYRAGVVDVRLSAPDVPTLDNIQRIVSASGQFAASIQSTDQVGDRVSSRIQIREGGA